MGEFAVDVQGALRERLVDRTDRDWETEHYVEGTPVDVASIDAPWVFVELEWRRADPANNPVKLARCTAAEVFDAPVLLVQCFSRYYDLSNGGVSSKRENAEFVGRLASEALESFSYVALTLDIDPPKRGGERPDGWQDAVDSLAVEIGAEVLG